MENNALIVTTIQSPTSPLKQMACESNNLGWNFVIIGDRKSPKFFQLEGCSFYSLERQLELPFKYAQKCPTDHYARKNIGYLLAFQKKASVIVETDDDNIPEKTFWAPRKIENQGHVISDDRWWNIYRCFSDKNIWPRGLPLNAIKNEPRRSELVFKKMLCPIQQGLTNGEPDVDAIYRLVIGETGSFLNSESVILSGGAWCPFNSQNTSWFPEAFPLLYLPAYCSFRMTDIWRSFVAVRWFMGKEKGILFHSATMHQNRNTHNLQKDFEDEIPGYQYNGAIREILLQVPNRGSIKDYMLSAYSRLIDKGYIGKEEIALLRCWLDDLEVTETQQ